jgi:hypothetical protein
VHTFNDMLIVLKKHGESTPQMGKRILLDHTSYVTRKRHLKYSKNMVMVCGFKQSTHLKFDTPADMNVFVDNVQSIINSLRAREDDKRQRFSENETKKHNVAKFKVSKWCEDLYFKIEHKAKLEITVEGTMKPSGNAYFFTKFRVIKPYRVSQTLMITR